MGSSVIQAFQALLVQSRLCSLQSSHLGKFDTPARAGGAEAGGALPSAGKGAQRHNQSPAVNETRAPYSDRRRQKAARRAQAAMPLERGTGERQ